MLAHRVLVKMRPAKMQAPDESDSPLYLGRSAIADGTSDTSLKRLHIELFANGLGIGRRSAFAAIGVSRDHLPKQKSHEPNHEKLR